MKRLFLVLFALLSAHAADYDQTSWRTQLYMQVSPYDPWTLKGSGADTSNVSFEAQGVPVTGGFLWNPLINPLFKVDLPFTFWIGGELGSFRMGDIADIGDYESFSYQAMLPAVVGGFTVNVAGDVDLRLLGGYGQQRMTFTSEFSGFSTSEHEVKASQAFASATLEYLVTEVFEGSDLKLGLNVRKNVLALENIRAVPHYETDETGRYEGSFPPKLNGLVFDKIESDLPVQIGIEISLDFGRESRRDRKVRYKLYDRTNVLQENNKGRDTLSEWDCMAIERDYKFFLEEDGALPDVRHKFTKSQFSDVLESFLAFCKPENLRTREQLFASLDSNKVELKRYQVSQEDSRYKQVMASNDVDMMKMFLQYYPNSRFRPNIESKVVILQDYKDFKAARNTNTFQSYLGYLATNLKGHYRKEAETGVFTLVQASNRIKDYEIYLKKFPEGLFVEEARRAIHELTKSGSY